MILQLDQHVPTKARRIANGSLQRDDIRRPVPTISGGTVLKDSAGKVLSQLDILKILGTLNPVSISSSMAFSSCLAIISLNPIAPPLYIPKSSLSWQVGPQTRLTWSRRCKHLTTQKRSCTPSISSEMSSGMAMR